MAVNSSRPLLLRDLASPPIVPRTAAVGSVCIFCGASPDPQPVYAAAAAELGNSLARAGVVVVYGGGCEGLMGIVARAACEAGGTVVGIMPDFMAERLPRLGYDHDFKIVESMHARKQAMFDAADAFIALPGGIGTLDEVVEQMTWAKLGRHSKPVVIANIGGFWVPLLRAFRHMAMEGFMPGPAHYTVSSTIAEVLRTLGLPTADAQLSGFSCLDILVENEGVTACHDVL